jgi:hypothetical protein
LKVDKGLEWLNLALNTLVSPAGVEPATS